MNPLKNIILSIGVLFLATSAFADPQSGIPPVIERYEQILLKSPEKEPPSTRSINIILKMRGWRSSPTAGGLPQNPPIPTRPSPIAI